MPYSGAAGGEIDPSPYLETESIGRDFAFRRETVSTNIDAAAGRHGFVACADSQTGGEGRIGHKWHSPPGVNLYFTAVLDCAGMEPAQAATFPLVAGLAVREALRGICPGAPDGLFMLKWPNDILADGKKACGILCLRKGDRILAGIGVNVNQTEFPLDIAGRATSLLLLRGGKPADRSKCLAAVLNALERKYAAWRRGGFAQFMDEVSSADWLKGRMVSVRQTDSDADAARGACGGIAEDGSLEVAGRRIYAGEAHVEAAL